MSGTEQQPKKAMVHFWSTASLCNHRFMQTGLVGFRLTKATTPRDGEPSNETHVSVGLVVHMQRSG